MRARVAFFLLSAQLIAAAACSRGEKKAPPPAKEESAPGPVSQDLLDTVVFLDADLAKRIVIEYMPRASRNRDGTLRVAVVLRNPSGTLVTVEGRVRFYDAKCVPSDGPTEWKTVAMPPHTTQVYDDHSAKRAEAAYFHVEIRKRKE